MNTIEYSLKACGFEIEYIGEKKKNMYSFIAQTERHCIVASVFEGYNSEEQCACATFNPTYLAEIKARYSKMDRPGFDAYVEADTAKSFPSVPGPRNHDVSVFEMQNWLHREYKQADSATQTEVFSRKEG